MDESAYWISLEYRICREFSGLRAKELRTFWCDGLIPETAELDGDPARISGRAWIGRGSSHQEAWDFSLLLADGVRSRREVDWESLLPADDVTGWLSIDMERNVITINPKAAYRDHSSDADV